MHKINIDDLLNKYRAGTLTEEEFALLEDWYLQWKPENQHLSHSEIEKAKEEVWQSLNIHPTSVKIVRLWPRIAVAASIILCLSAGGYLLLRTKQQHQQVAQNTYKNDIAPGGNKATLTLSNGSKVDLNDQKNGVISQQGNARVVKLSNGQVAYNEEGKTFASAVYNTLSTPRGGKYDLTLSDGTRVWLNAASSITYPTVFNRNDRTVNITGEVYFEVVHDAKKKFRVIADGQVVEDIGTQFDVNAYHDEPNIKTTLVEGSVRVSSKSISNILRPGEQSRLIGENFQVENVNVDEAIAWKNGKFYFENASVAEVMRQLSRWYDIEIKYEHPISDRQFSGAITKDVNISQILDLLKFEGISCKIENKTLIITELKTN